jgi:FkbM family methyltransferase
LYPNALLTAVEAGPAIFGVLSGNIERAKLSSVTLINRTVSGTRDDVLFNVEGADGGRVHAYAEAKATQRIKAITPDDLIIGPVDFLKIDIEGAETAALSACSKLNQVKEAFIEYHSFADDDQSLAEILSILSASGFRYLIQTQHCSPRPFTEKLVHMNMDLQLNIFSLRQ